MSIITSVKQNKLKSTFVFVTLVVLLLMIFMVNNKVAPVAWGFYGDTNTDNNIALQGGDAVAYFTEGKYSPGNPEISYVSNGVSWHFVSEANKQLFVATPDKFMPQYGGYCAFAVSKGVTANSQPEVWTIENGKLYIFNDSNVKKEWMADIKSGSISTSDENWSARF